MTTIADAIHGAARRPSRGHSLAAGLLVIAFTLLLGHSMARALQDRDRDARAIAAWLDTLRAVDQVTCAGGDGVECDVVLQGGISLVIRCEDGNAWTCAPVPVVRRR